MQNQKEYNLRFVIWIGIAAFASLVGLAGGLGLASVILDSDGSGLGARHRETLMELSQAQAEIQRIQSDLEESLSNSQVLQQELTDTTDSNELLDSKLFSAEKELAQQISDLDELSSQIDVMSTAGEKILGLQQQVEELRSQVNEQPAKPDVLDGMVRSMENHRVLLVELRKDLPIVREEAITYWRSVKSLAAEASSSLASQADMVILGIENYFDWQDRTPNPSAPVEDYLDWLSQYELSGAVAYDGAIDNFLKDTLLSIISQLDAVKVQLE